MVAMVLMTTVNEFGIAEAQQCKNQVAFATGSAQTDIVDASHITAFSVTPTADVTLKFETTSCSYIFREEH